MSAEECINEINAKGEEVKAFKTANKGVAKDDPTLTKLIGELLALKTKYKEIAGVDFKPPEQESSKKKKEPVVKVPESFMSKPSKNVYTSFLKNSLSFPQKEEAKADQSAEAAKGPNKKELNKLARKAGRKGDGKNLAITCCYRSAHK